ncbi:MAG TPA: YjfB family protein [Burkholderiaceae bacterium]|nr:YjfB family protein [Burkholderiaceae bacterium]
MKIALKVGVGLNEEVIMDITNSSSVNAATLAAQSGTADAVNILVLKKAIDTQAAGALALIGAVPQEPALATEGVLGRNVNTYA